MMLSLTNPEPNSPNDDLLNVEAKHVELLDLTLRRFKQSFRIKLASFRRDQGSTVKVHLKSIPTIV